MPWISIPDAKRCHGGVINDTEESTNALGIANSSARLIPAGAVCLSRTASVGYVVITGRPMATSQDFVNWICGDQLLPEFLQHLFLAEGDNLLRFASGAVHKTIYFPEVKAFHVCVPDRATQRRIVDILDKACKGVATAKANAEKNLQNARELLQVQHEAIFSKVDGRLIRLGDIASFRNGINYTKQSKGREVRIVGVRDFQNHLWAPLDELEAVTLDGELSAADILAEGDILTVRSNGNPELIGRSMLVGELPEPVSHSGFTIRTRLHREDALPLYVCQFMRSRPVRRQLVDGGNGANIKSLNQGGLAGIELRLPTIDVQTRVVKQLDAISIETERLAGIARAKLAALDELKRSLLHQAFTSGLSPSNDRPPQGDGLQMCTQ